MSIAAANGQTSQADAILQAAVVDVPLVVTSVEANPLGARLWVDRGDVENALLARVTVRPVQVAAIAGGPPLWRAFAGGGVTRFRADELPLDGGPRQFCGPAPEGRRLACYIDEDGDGSFDHVAAAVGEAGGKPYHVTVMRGPRLLDRPQPYRVLADDQRPTVSVEIRNCQRDYDRPRFSARSTEDKDQRRASGFGWPAKGSSFAACRRGDQIAGVEGQTPAIPKGGYLAQMGPLAFTVGPKTDARVALVGQVDAQTLYRLEGASLIELAVGRTPNQAQLVARKKFPYPLMVADDGGEIRAGEIAPGAEVASIPFHHAYRGRLTRDISISTLFGKRSIAAGTVVYGFPAEEQITRGGIPNFGPVDDARYRNLRLALTWCTPVHEDGPVKDKPNEAGRGGWSAACIPHSSMGRHTILNNRQPAFGVSGVTYAVDTASNDGPPPIERADDAAFAQPLRLAYVFERKAEDALIFREEIYFGSALTSSSIERVFAPAGVALVKIAGAPVELSASAGGALVVKPLGAPVRGETPTLAWDQTQYLRQQLAKLGFTVDPKSEPDAGPDAGPGDAE